MNLDVMHLSCMKGVSAWCHPAQCGGWERVVLAAQPAATHPQLALVNRPAGITLLRAV